MKQDIDAVVQPRLSAFFDAGRFVEIGACGLALSQI